jgi:mRNA interferase MazF
VGRQRIVRQGDIFMCNLTLDSIDSEQSGTRPVLVVSVDARNETSQNVFIFPITHAQKKVQPCHYILLKSDYPFLTYDRQIVLCEEGRSISKRRLERFLGKISNEDIGSILKCKEYVFVAKDETL